MYALALSALLAACPEPAAPPAAPPPAADPAMETAALVGFWEVYADHGNWRRNDSLLFWADGTWARRAQGYEQLPASFPATAPAPEVARGGTWKLDGGRLALTTTWADVYQGGALVAATDIAPATVQGGAVTREPREPSDETITPAAALIETLDATPNPAWTFPLGGDARPWVRWSAEGDPAEAWCTRGGGGPVDPCPK